MKRLSDDEVKKLMNQTRQELYLQDPEPVILALGLEYKRIGNDSYRMNIRGEKTPSAFISLKHGRWKYKDFGNGHGGTIENVVMDATGMGYKEALNYSLQHLGVKNFLEEALTQNNTHIVNLTDEQKQKIEDLKKRNLQRESSHPISKVTGVYEVSTNKMAVEYLKARGITKIPPYFKVIAGEYENKHGEIKKVFGVGVETLHGGADIHFLQKIGDLKTFQLGEKDISFFKNPNSNKVAIFESKMDYAAAYQQMDLSKVNVVIANSTSNAQKVADLLKKERLEKNVMMFNQNDLPGYRFVADVAKNAEIGNFKCIKYNVMSEYSQDINDLLVKNEKIADRIEIRDAEYFQNIADSLETIKKMQNQKSVTREDLQRADRACEQQSQENGVKISR